MLLTVSPERIYYFHLESIAVSSFRGSFGNAKAKENHSGPQLMAMEIKNVNTVIGSNRYTLPGFHKSIKIIMKQKIFDIGFCQNERLLRYY